LSRSNQKILASRQIRLGFVALIDAAPLIAAFELGYFQDEALNVLLSRELGWANVRDKLAFNRLDAAHALLGLPIHSALHDRSAGEPIRAVMALGSGGDAITLSQRLVDAGVNSALTLGRYARQSRDAERLVFAHVFESSVHHYLLREWLAGGEIDPDHHVRLCVLPPPQMSTHINARHVDGFCVGEPWNSFTQEHRAGRIVALTSDLVPAHPDKVLAVNERWAEQESATVVAMIRAILRGGQYCADPANARKLAAMLSRRYYLNIPQAVILNTLLLDRSFGQAPGRANLRPFDWTMRSFDATFPSHTHAAWLITHMQRWGHVDADVDPFTVAARACDTSLYRTAAASLGIDSPSADSPPMRLRDNRRFERTTGMVQTAGVGQDIPW
jgi:ABC-type nitrate/sulfonate/bicarbonate transport system substrate-binding protein